MTKKIVECQQRKIARVLSAATTYQWKTIASGAFEKHREKIIYVCINMYSLYPENNETFVLQHLIYGLEHMSNLEHFTVLTFDSFLSFVFMADTVVRYVNNPGSRTVLSCRSLQFEKIFICLSAQKQGFLPSSRPHNFSGWVLLEGHIWGLAFNYSGIR